MKTDRSPCFFVFFFSSERNQSRQMPRDPKLIWRAVIYTFLKAKIFSVAAKLKALRICFWLHVQCVAAVLLSCCGSCLLLLYMEVAFSNLSINIMTWFSFTSIEKVPRKLSHQLSPCSYITSALHYFFALDHQWNARFTFQYNCRLSQNCQT